MTRYFKKKLKQVVKHLPADSEMVNIGFHKFECMQHFVPWDLTRDDDYKTISSKIVNEHICKIKPGMNPCSLSYIITLQGAKNMVEYFEKNGFLRATDGNFNDYLEARDIFYCSFDVLVTGNHLLKSTIFV